MRTIIKKMIRHWPRFLLLFLILMFVMLLCYLVGQVYVQAVISAREIEENAITLAVPTSPYEVSYIMSVDSTIPDQVNVWKQERDPVLMEKVGLSESVRNAETSISFAAQIKGVTPVVPSSFDALQRASGNYLDAENSAALTVNIRSIEQRNLKTGKVIQGKIEMVEKIYYVMEADVLEVNVLNPDYGHPAQLQIHSTLVQEDGSIPFEVGNTYTVAGRFSPFQPQNEAEMQNLSGVLYLEITGYPIKEHLAKNTMGKLKLGALHQPEYPLYMQPDHPGSGSMLDILRFNQTMLGCTGVDTLDVLPFFAKGDAYIVDGRSFTKEESKNGAAVCLVSQSLANKNNLQVGQQVSLSLYPATFTEKYGADGAHAALMQTFPIPEKRMEKEYTIIGIYQAPEYVNLLHCFSPNTVFVPKAGLPADGLPGVSYANSFLLKNGSQQQFLMDAQAAGLPSGTFEIIEDGYLAYKGSLNAMQNDTLLALIACCIVNVIVCVSALYLLDVHLKKDTQVMSKLGATCKQRNTFRLGCTLPLVILASCLAYILCCSIYKPVLERISRMYTTSAPLFSELTNTGDLLSVTGTSQPPIWFIGAGMLPSLAAAFLFICFHRKEENK